MTLETLNSAIADGTIRDLIQVEEARQRKTLSKIADLVCGRPKIRLVLLAGGSAAGKTTTAKRLVTQIRVNDRAAALLSTDDYFVGDRRNPRDENGELDYEHVNCVDIPLLVADLNALFRGEEIPVRRFDFIRHEPAVPKKTMRLKQGGFVVLEGIHALNPILTEGVDDSSKFRVFVEPKPTLDVCVEAAAKSSGARFLRRLVRDSQFRKMDPSVTFDMWPKVQAGEAKWIRPFCTDLDATFNSYLDYELAVLKPYVLDLVARSGRDITKQDELEMMLKIMESVTSTSSDFVPGDSILRETIGGSQLEY